MQEPYTAWTGADIPITTKDSLGRIGASGNVTGPHLHYGVLEPGSPCEIPLDFGYSANCPNETGNVDPWTKTVGVQLHTPVVIEVATDDLRVREGPNKFSETMPGVALAVGQRFVATAEWDNWYRTDSPCGPGSIERPAHACSAWVAKPDSSCDTLDLKCVTSLADKERLQVTRESSAAGVYSDPTSASHPPIASVWQGQQIPMMGSPVAGGETESDVPGVEACKADWYESSVPQLSDSQSASSGWRCGDNLDVAQNVDCEAQLALAENIGLAEDAYIKLYDDLIANEYNAHCQAGLSLLYERGDGVIADPELAFFYAEESAKQDNPSGQYLLGRAYELGIGTEMNVPAAIEWYRLAADQGNESAESRLDELETNPVELTPDLFAEGAISPVGDSDEFEFEASAGDAVHIRVTDLQNTGLSPLIELYSPDGTLLRSDSDGITPELDCYSASSSCSLNQTGTYRLIVRDVNDNDTGSYEIRIALISNANDSGDIPINGMVSGQITLGDLDTFVFNATAGDAVHIRVADVLNTGFTPEIWLYKPDGSYLACDSDGFTAEIECLSTSFFCSLNQTGTYRVLVMDAGSDNPGSYEIEFER